MRHAMFGSHFCHLLSDLRQVSSLFWLSVSLAIKWGQQEGCDVDETCTKCPECGWTELGKGGDYQREKYCLPMVTLKHNSIPLAGRYSHPAITVSVTLTHVKAGPGKQGKAHVGFGRPLTDSPVTPMWARCLLGLNDSHTHNCM